MNISLPDSMGAYVEEQVLNNGYSSASEYFRELVLQDQKRKAQERLKQILLEGLNSGTATELTSDDWENLRHAVREKVAKH